MNDIQAIESNKGINNKNTVCSTTVTGYSYTRLIRPNYPVDLTIESIQDKFDNRFDDPSYYYGIGNNTLVGG